jgi:hypothetical protein
MTDNREPTDAEWVRLEESWTATAIDPWQIDIAEDEPPRSGAVIVWALGAIIAALIVAVAWLAWTR